MNLRDTTMQKINKQAGVFSIEMAFVLIGMCAALYFCFDLGYQQIRKSQLERVSYSLVSVLKERTLFYQKKEQVSTEEVNDLHLLAVRLLNIKNNSQVSVVVDQRIQGQPSTQIRSTISQVISCKPHQMLSDKFDITLEKTGKKAPVYQVTVCQQIPAWFESVISGEAKNSRILQVQSTFIGR